MHDCWICGSVANTSEHSVKKTDLKTIFSNKPTRFIAHHFDEEYNTKRKTLIQGLNSKHLKYDKDLCENCNTNLTRPYDLAYEEFIKYVFKNEKVIIGERIIHLQQIFPKDRKRKQLDLFKFLIKSFGCVLNSAKLPVPSELVDALNGQNVKNNLYVVMSIPERNDIPLTEIKGASNYNLQSLEPLPSNYTWGQSRKWLCITYWYNRIHPPELGQKWTGKSKEIVLGVFPKSEENEITEAIPEDVQLAARPISASLRGSTL